MNMTETILVFNSGSSSFKFSLFAVQDEALILSGIADKLGHPDAYLEIKASSANGLVGNKHRFDTPDATHRHAIQQLIEVFPQFGVDFDNVVSVGHRVVHGGEKFASSVIINEDVIREIAACNNLAPLHNPKNLLGIEILQDLSPNLPQVAVFDTAFHQTLPQTAYLYAVPWHLYTDLGVRRYGFHGTSHRYVAGRAVESLGLDPLDHQLLVAHLGNGCSAAAIVNGRSVDTTMGLTPLEGLMMGTRSGDVDPSLHGFLHEHLGWSLDRITATLNNESGLLGLSGLSNDMRKLYDAAQKGNQQAQLAFDIFCFRTARQLSALTASLTRIDALVFTGGIGENQVQVRESVIRQLAIFGFILDAEANREHGQANRGVITAPSSTRACVINTNEELMIARDCLALLAD